LAYKFAGGERSSNKYTVSAENFAAKEIPCISFARANNVSKRKQILMNNYNLEKPFDVIIEFLFKNSTQRICLLFYILEHLPPGTQLAETTKSLLLDMHIPTNHLMLII
jgi:hypothetical protein